MRRLMKLKGTMACLCAAVLCTGAGIVLQSNEASAETVTLTPIARYEFKDATNLGKDSMGNFDLLTYGNVLTNGSDDSGYYLNFASGGMLYAAEPYETSKDFVDYLTDYTISFDLKKDMPAGGGEWNPVLATGNGYTTGLTVFAANGNIDAKHVGTDVVCPATSIDASTWGNVTFTFDKSTGTFKCYVNGTLVTTDTNWLDFAIGGTDFSFAIGGRYNQWSDTLLENTATNGSIRDVRVYDVALSQENVTALCSGNEAVVDASTVISTVTATSNYKVRPELENAEILAMSDLFNVTAVDMAGNTYSGLKSVYTSLERSTDKLTVKGVIVDGSVSNALGKTFEGKIEFYTESDELLLKPIAHYEFNDATNLGKDSMGNFDLLTYGTGLTNCTDTDGGYLNFAENSLLYAPETEIGKDLSDYLSDYTISFKLKKEVATGEWNPILATGNGYTGGLTVFAANGNIDAKHVGTDVVCPATALNENEWGTVTLTFDKSANTFKCYVNGALTYTYTTSNFALGYADFAFAIGGRYNQWSDSLLEGSASSGSIRDVRVYDCVLNHQNVKDLASGKDALVDGTVIETINNVPTANFKISSALTDAQILSMPDLAPSTVSVTLSDGSIVTEKVVYLGITRTADGAVIRGIPLGGNSNATGAVIVVEVPFATESDAGELKPFAHYEFKDATNLGKDSMGNFDLLTYGTLTNGSDDNGSYLNFEDTGALYAAELSDGVDFSDYLKDYTISFRLRKDVATCSEWAPILATGNGYANGSGEAGITVFASNGNIDVKLSGKDMAVDYLTSAPELTALGWSTVTLAYDSLNTTLKVYVNGLLKGTHNGNFNLGLEYFAFTIGGRYNQWSESMVDAGVGTELAGSGSIKDVRIYANTLSSQNVYDLHNSTSYQTVMPNLYITEVKALQIDTLVTAENKIADVLSALPVNATAIMSDGSEKEISMVWLGLSNGKINGFLSTSYASACRVSVNLALHYAQVLTETNVTWKNVCVNGVTYNGDYKLSYGDVLTFEIEVPANYMLKSVSLNGATFEDVDGVYTLTVTDSNSIVATAEAIKYCVKYNTDTVDGIINKYYTVADGELTLLTVSKEGYTFDGWYADPAFTGEPVTAISASEAKDFELWAKFTRIAYVVTFKDGTDVLKTENVAFGMKVAEYAPEKEGYTFEGWYTDEELTNLYDEDALVQSDLTLYAKFTENAVEPGAPNGIDEIKDLIISSIDKVKTRVGCSGSVSGMSILALGAVAIALTKKKRK